MAFPVRLGRVLFWERIFHFQDTGFMQTRRGPGCRLSLRRGRLGRGIDARAVLKVRHTVQFAVT